METTQTNALDNFAFYTMLDEIEKRYQQEKLAQMLDQARNGKFYTAEEHKEWFERMKREKWLKNTK